MGDAKRHRLHHHNDFPELLVVLHIAMSIHHLIELERPVDDGLSARLARPLTMYSTATLRRASSPLILNAAWGIGWALFLKLFARMRGGT